MKSQQTLRHSDTQPLITTKSVNQPVTPWLAMTIMSDHSLQIGDSPLMHWDSFLTLTLILILILILTETETETETQPHHVTFDNTATGNPPEDITCQEVRMMMDGVLSEKDWLWHSSLMDTWSLEITENHWVSQCHTDEHRLAQSDTDSQRGAARNMDCHIVSMWHWVVNGIGWWFSWPLGIEGDEYHSVVASMGIIWTQRHRWTLTEWWHSLDDDSHGWWVPSLVTSTGREQSPSDKRHRLLTLHEQC